MSERVGTATRCTIYDGEDLVAVWCVWSENAGWPPGGVLYIIM